MKYINALMEELWIYSEEYAAEKINHEEYQLKLDLIIRKVERIGINSDATRLSLQSNLFNPLLLQRKYKARTALRELRQVIDDRRQFNAKVHEILASKLGFLNFYQTLKQNIDLYQERDGKKPVDPQIFIPGDDQEHE